MDRLIGALRDLGFDEARILVREDMARHTTMRVGGPADVMACACSPDEVRMALCEAARLGVPALVIGGGSNLIVRDGGVRGLVLKLGDAFSRVAVEDCVVTAQAGARLSQLGAAAQRAGLAGLEFASGIPGTVGGGVAMNAGAYGGEMKDVLLWADLLMDGGIVRVPVEEMDLGYRHSRALEKGYVVLGAAFSLTPDDPARIMERMNELGARRRDKQPLSHPSSGSTFKRPEGHFAGALIERAGLKGVRVGGAQVSEKHAGFVVNADGATAQDVLTLIEQIKARVMAHAGVALECEVRVVGEA